jgi:prepilin-type N-terminal cleavage/methylation domain-containing protein
VSNLLKKDKGFTLIEIVLVLAIAGLLLVIVFLAVQGAQRSRRDTQRKNDAARMLAAWESCAANNNGNYGAPCNNFANLANATTGYFRPNVAPGGAAYGNAAPSAANPNNLTLNPGGTCAGSTHPAVVIVGQENGNQYCVGN